VAAALATGLADAAAVGAAAAAGDDSATAAATVAMAPRHGAAGDWQRDPAAFGACLLCHEDVLCLSRVSAAAACWL
jgi:hypothetical protein